MDLFGGTPGTPTAFGRMPGHLAFSQPILLAEIISGLGKVGEFYRHAWAHYRASSALGSIRTLVDRARSRPPEGELVKLTADILSRVRAVRWEQISTHTREYQLVRALIDHSSRENLPKRVDACYEVMNQMDRVLTALGVN